MDCSSYTATHHQSTRTKGVEQLGLPTSFGVGGDGRVVEFRPRGEPIPVMVIGGMRHAPARGTRDPPKEAQPHTPL